MDFLDVQKILCAWLFLLLSETAESFYTPADYYAPQAEQIMSGED